MADVKTQILDRPYKKIVLRKTSNLSNIFIFNGTRYFPADKCEIITKFENNSGIVSVKASRSIENISDLIKNVNKLYFNDGLDIEIVGKSKGVFAEDIIKSYNSTSVNAKDKSIPYGLRRNLEVSEASTKDDDNYLCVEINGKKEFLKKSEIFWMDGDVKKDLTQAKSLSDIQFFDEDDKQINTLYTEKEYVFNKTNSSEAVDLNKFNKATYNINKKGELKEFNIKLNRTLSKQEFTTKEEDSARKGKTKIVHMIKTTNYQYDKDGDFIAVNVNNELKIVPISSLETENGDSIADKQPDGTYKIDVDSIINKQLKIVKDDTIIGTTDPITFEQATIRYNSIKTYQPFDGKTDDKTCLRLANGNYVKELKSVQPKSYKIATNPDDFDCYLLENIVDGKFEYSIIDKDYYIKNQKTKKFRGLNVFKVQHCDFNDKKCIAVQKTSNGEPIQQCDLINDFETKISNEDGSKSVYTCRANGDRKKIYEEFLKAYKEGNYKVSYVYIDGKKEDLAENCGKFIYTDESLREVDEKYAESKKYDIGKRISSGFKKYIKFLKKTAGFALIAAAIPVIGPMITATYAVGVLAAIPVIPTYHIINGGVRNLFMSKDRMSKDNFKKYNNEQVKEINFELENLFDLVKNKKISNEIQFEDAFATHVMDRVLALSKTVRINSKGEKEFSEDPRYEFLLNKAASLKLYTYLTEFKESKLTKNEFKNISVFTDRLNYDNGLTIDGISIFADEKTLNKAFKNNTAKLNDWQDIRSKVFDSMETIKSSLAVKPKVYDVENEMLENIAKEEKVKAKLEEIEKEYGEFNEISKEIETNLEINSKDVYLNEFNKLITEVENAYNDSKFKEELEEVENCLSVIIDKKKSASELLDKIKEDIITNGRQLILDEITSIYNNAEQNINNWTSTSYNPHLNGFVNLLNNNLASLAEIKNEIENVETSNEIAKELLNKARIIAELINIEIEFLKLISKNNQAFAGLTEGSVQLYRSFNVSLVMSLEELTSKLNDAQAGYSTVQALIPNTEKAKEKTKKNEGEKTSRTRLSNNIINAENAVITELEDESSETYKRIMHLLTKSSKKFKMTKEEAKRVIFKFTVDANLAHDQRKYAQDIFEKDSVEDYILSKAKLQMAKAITNQL